ncbi:MAG: hypothetical protein Q8907_06800 [Bacteroidota bacterium]|nr:hypothetical protein [Bacteroidota bacterium]
MQNPYRQTMANVPSKGRFSPLLFSGTMFSSGGYSAEYGQALSSALVLSTNSMPSDNLANINLYSMGFGLSMQRVFRNNSAIVLSYDHSDLDPYYKVVKQNIDWTTPPKAHFLTFNYFKKTSNSGMLKSMFSLNMDKSGLYYPTSEMDYTFIKDEKQNELDTELKSFGLLNNNKYVFSISDKNTMNISLGLSYDKRNVGLEQFNNLDLCDNFFLSELKIKDIISITDRNKLSYGIDYQLNYFKESIKRNEVDTELDYTDHSIATYAELESYVMRRFTTRVGVRAEYSSVLNLFKVSPRLSLAYSLGDLGLFSFAYGTFFQNPESEYLKFTRKLKPERAEHFILDYQYERNKRVFRLEAYYKKYHNLIKYTSYDTNPDSYNNAGSGYAKGLEVFYRDKKTIPGGDFWISYSLMDTKRDYRDFPILAMPKYFSKHNFSFVYKHWIRAIHSNVGLTNNWMSGRHYYDPNKPVEQFMKDKTKPYNDLCINYTYDFSSYTKWPVTLFFSVTNLLGQNHVFGFSYAKNDHDTYDLYPIKPMAKRTYTFAILITLK